jgi:hypothetical protein
MRYSGQDGFLWRKRREVDRERSFNLQSQFARSGQRSLRTSMLRRPWEVWRITNGCVSIGNIVAVRKHSKSARRHRKSIPASLFMILRFRGSFHYSLSPSTPICLPVSCQYLTIAGVESIIVPSMSKSRAEKSTTSAGAEKLFSSW